MKIFYLGKRSRFLMLGKQGLACFWFILIDKRRQHDSGLIEHEMIHIKQMKETGLLTYLFKYFTSQRFRASVEAEAFLHGSKLHPLQVYSVLLRKYRISAHIINKTLGI